MKKIISALILTALLLSSLLAIIPVAAEEEAAQKVNVLATTKDDQMNGVGPAFYYNYHLFEFDIGKYPLNKSPQEDGTTKNYAGNTKYMLRAVNAANGGATSIDGLLDSYEGSYHTFHSEGKDVIDTDGVSYHFDSYLGISLKETKSIDSFKFYTLSEQTKGGKVLIENLYLFGARLNPETHTFDPNSWFLMYKSDDNIQENLTEDGKFAVAEGEFFMPFDVDYIFMAFNCAGTGGGDYIVVELEAYEYIAPSDTSGLDFSKINASLTTAEAELAKENAYTTESYDALTKAYNEAKAILSTTSQKAIDYLNQRLEAALTALAPLADTSILVSELERYAAYEEASFTVSSWTAFAAARDAAVALVESNNASQANIDACLMALSTTASELAVKASADALATLKAKFEEASALDHTLYTPKSFAAIRVAQRDSNQLVKEENKDDVSAEQCEAAIATFDAAFAELKERANLEVLQAALDEVLSISAKNYTAESYAPLAQAIVDAKTFLADAGNNSTEEEAAALAAAILAAKDALVLLADFSALDAALAEVGALVAENYTAESWAALDAAITAANALKENASAPQADVDAAVATIEAAKAALVEAKVEAPTDDEKPTDAPTATEKPTDAPTATEKPTDAPEATAAPGSDATAIGESGCGSVIGIGAVVITAVLGLGAVALKKKED